MSMDRGKVEMRLAELPMLPAVLVKLLSLDTENDDYFEDVITLGNEDPTFAVRLVQLSNSTFSSPSEQITTLQQAVVRVGVKAILSMITGLSVLKVFNPKTDGERNLWIHAVETAIIARNITRVNKTLAVDPEAAYLCGLLHDIGRFVLFDANSKQLSRVDEAHWESPQQLVEIEQRILGINHALVGFMACKKWELPILIAEVVKLHHQYKLVGGGYNDPKVFRVLNVVQMADFYSVVMRTNDDLLDSTDRELMQLVTKKCIHPAWQSPPATARQLVDMLPAVTHETTAVRKDLGI